MRRDGLLSGLRYRRIWIGIWEYLPGQDTGQTARHQVLAWMEILGCAAWKRRQNGDEDEYE
ncbi:MAG: hypothetical protein HFG65_05080 [Hungatella sp.]|nr:hypothetical protein [Hungatella sp.]